MITNNKQKAIQLNRFLLIGSSKKNHFILSGIFRKGLHQQSVFLQQSYSVFTSNAKQSFVFNIDELKASSLPYAKCFIAAERWRNEQKKALPDGSQLKESIGSAY